MPRQAIFSTDTKLWHPSEGWKTFPAGEQDPGPAWHDKEGGDAPGKATATQALQDLIAAQEQIEQRDQMMALKDHDLAQAAKAREEAEAKVAGLEQAAADAEKAKAEAEATAAEVTAERDHAQGQATAEKARADKLDAELTAARATIERLTGELAAAEQLLADAQAEVAKVDPDGDGKVGGSRKKAPAE